MASESNLQRFVYKRATLDDLEKLGLRSHKPEKADEPQGGGARDVRFRPWKQFEPVFSRMFASDNEGSRVRFAGKLWFLPASPNNYDEVMFWSPTGARGDEGWLARSYKVRAFTNNLPPGPDPPVFFCFAQATDGKVWGGWMKEADLREGRWHPDVAGPVLNALKSARPGSPIRGYVDFVRGLEEHFGV